MNQTASRHAIAPAQVLRGKGVWHEAIQAIRALGLRPLLLGRSGATAQLRQGLRKDLDGAGFITQPVDLRWDCCEADLERLARLVGSGQSQSADLVIAVGGGKVLDAGKLLADRCELPCVTVPTSAATCAGWTALANIYSTQGAFQRDQPLKR